MWPASFRAKDIKYKGRKQKSSSPHTHDNSSAVHLGWAMHEFIGRAMHESKSNLTNQNTKLMEKMTTFSKQMNVNQKLFRLFLRRIDNLIQTLRDLESSSVYTLIKPYDIPVKLRTGNFAKDCAIQNDIFKDLIDKLLDRLDKFHEIKKNMEQFENDFRRQFEDLKHKHLENCKKFRQDFESEFDRINTVQESNDMLFKFFNHELQTNLKAADSTYGDAWFNLYDKCGPCCSSISSQHIANLNQASLTDE